MSDEGRGKLNGKISKNLKFNFLIFIKRNLVPHTSPSIDSDVIMFVNIYYTSSLVVNQNDELRTYFSFLKWIN